MDLLHELGLNEHVASVLIDETSVPFTFRVYVQRGVRIPRAPAVWRGFPVHISKLNQPDQGTRASA